MIKAARARSLPRGGGWRHCDHKPFGSPWNSSAFLRKPTYVIQAWHNVPRASWRSPRALPNTEAASVQPSAGEHSTIHTAYKTSRNQSDPRDHITAIDALNGHLRKWKWWASGRKWPERRAARLRPCTSGKEILQLPWGILKKEEEPMKTLKDSSTLLHSCFL